MGIENRVRQITGNRFQTFVHPIDEMKRLIEAAGFAAMWQRQTLVWRVDVYARKK